MSLHVKIYVKSDTADEYISAMNAAIRAGMTIETSSPLEGYLTGHVDRSKVGQILEVESVLDIKVFRDKKK